MPAPLLPTPLDAFGFAPGTDRKLVPYDAMLDYFDRLAALTPRLKVEEIGRSAEGRRLVALILSSEANLARLEELRGMQLRLGDPRGLDPQTEAALVEGGRAIGLATFGVHPAEVASAETAPVLVHHLLTDDAPETRAIRDEVITIVVPSVNPDGFKLVTDWYDKTLGTTAEGTWPPTLTQKYAGGENNRDWTLLTQPEQRAVVERVLRRWNPHLRIDHHQMEEYGPRYWVPPYADPSNAQIDPAIQAATGAAGAGILAALTAQGLGGVVSGVFFSQYSPASVSEPYHGGVHILTEAASSRLGTPHDIPRERLEPFHGIDMQTPRTCHPLPWEGGRWGLREAMACNMTATLTVLSDLAGNRRAWARRQAAVRRRAAQAEPGSCFVLPPHPADPALRWSLVEALMRGGVEVHEAGAAFSADGAVWPAGAYVVLLDQPAANFARALLQPQSYPVIREADGTVRRPYDVTVAELPLFFGLACAKLDARPDAPLARLSPDAPPAPPAPPEGAAHALPPHGAAAARAANLLLDAGVELRRGPAGLSFAAPPAALAETLARAPADLVAIDPEGLASLPALRRPRLGVYRSWLTGFFACDEGWLRFVLDAHAFPYATLRNRDLHRADLFADHDVIVIPQHLPGDLLHGRDPYAFAGATPHERERGLDAGGGPPLGDYPEEYAEGIGAAGLAGLAAFVEAGGTLIVLDTSCDVAIEGLKLPVRNVLAGVPQARFYNPGSVMRVGLRAGDPLAAGLGETASILFVNSPAFEVGEGAEAAAVYEGPEALVAGWMVGAELLTGRAALVRVPRGRGSILLFGFRPHFRAQMRVSYRLLFNAIFSAGRVEG